MGFAEQEGQHQCPRCRRYYPPGAVCGWCPEHPPVEDPAVIAERDAHEAQRASEALSTEGPPEADAPHADAPSDVEPPATPAPAAPTPAAPTGRTRRER